MTDFNIAIHIEERHGLRRTGEAIRIGVPLPRGLVREPEEVVVIDSAGRRVPHQAASLGRWPDRTVKWLLVDALVELDAWQRSALFVRANTEFSPDDRGSRRQLRVTAREGALNIDTGAARFEIVQSQGGPLASVTLGNAPLLDEVGVRTRLIGSDDTLYEPVVERLTIDERGPLRATVVAEGSFGSSQVTPIRFESRAIFAAGSAAVQLDFRIRNTRAALHAGGTWDLGDPGSWFFKDLTVSVRPRGPVRGLRCYAQAPDDERDHADSEWVLYQDSSGGEHWDSPNHIDRESKPTVAFRGYRISGNASSPAGSLGEGNRASPGITVVSADSWIAAGVKDFWQNFPKALRWRGGVLSVGLFPSEAGGLFELQGGEQKRHTIFLDFGAPGTSPGVAELQRPVAAWVDPAWIEASRAIVWFSAKSDDDHAIHADYVRQIIEGPNSFFGKREIIDEYGWRHFGELYGDHEAVHHQGPRPFISHYNNQYDFIYGAFVHFERSGDQRWRDLLEDAARHVIDIDIYHTQHDKAAFNGGLFWHTDHYMPALTCTHRTYSRGNGAVGAYGGGPSNEHNYTSGLLHYHYLTGDQEAAGAVRELAEWVLGMDDGARTLFGLIDSGQTGGASKTLEATFHRPGRGAGNSINALLDAYVLTREHRYLAKAEALIQRCIHPADDILTLQLEDPEHRWSYLVFLQVLGKYLEMKVEMGETDYAFHYARESLVHYAGWMADHEVPYKDVLHKVELPTETWPAQDVRKSHVLHLAAAFCAEPEHGRLRERAAFFFERCLSDLLEFSTAYVTRPLVILCVYGSVHDYFRKYGTARFECAAHNHDFGSPFVFLPQRARLRSTLALRLRVLAAELTRVFRDKVHTLRARMSRSG